MLSILNFLMLDVALTPWAPHASDVRLTGIYQPEPVRGPASPKVAFTKHDHSSTLIPMSKITTALPRWSPTTQITGYNQDWSPWVCCCFFQSLELNVLFLKGYDRIQWFS